MLPYARDGKTGEGAYDESMKQARVVRRDSSTLYLIRSQIAFFGIAESAG